MANSSNLVFIAIILFILFNSFHQPATTTEINQTAIVNESHTDTAKADTEQSTGPNQIIWFALVFGAVFFWWSWRKKETVDEVYKRECGERVAAKGKLRRRKVEQQQNQSFLLKLWNRWLKLFGGKQ